MEKKSSFMSREVSERISGWIKHYADRARIEKLVVGVSGGVDSAVVSTLCAMTGLETHVVSMPIRQDREQLLRANYHMDVLQKKYPNVIIYNVSLDSAFSEMESIFHNLGTTSELALANTRSRLRMTALYHIACSIGGIVVGTGNKVEDFGVGFFTKYGDGGVDISPIADMTKTEVWLLAKHLGVSEEIVTAKPTDGLWGTDRSDEDQLGATYPELERAMEFLEENDHLEEAEYLKKLDSLGEREREVIDLYISLHRKNLHKMKEIPVFKLPKHLKYE